MAKHLLAALAIAIATSACSNGSREAPREYPVAGTAAAGGLVGPLKDDTGPVGRSWVDGQPITDWPAEISKRDHAIDAYLNDADPQRASQYGFRAGQTPQLAWSWFR